MSFSKGSWLNKKHTKARHKTKWKKHLVINETELGDEKRKNQERSKETNTFVTNTYMQKASSTEKIGTTRNEVSYG